MSESNNEIPKKTNSAKKTFTGLIIFAIICFSITYVCIYMTLKTKNQTKDIVEAKNQYGNETQDEFVSATKKSKHKTLKLTDKAYFNGITEVVQKENYGEVVDYYDYNNESVYKFEIEYVQISGLKDRNVQASINQAIKDKVDELTEKHIKEIDNKDIDRISINASISANFSDILSICINEYVGYDYDDDNYDNDTYESNTYGLNFSLNTGEKITFKNLFWEDSPVKTILSQCLYKSFAWDYAFSAEDWNWDWNMENLDYSGIESKIYNFMYKYNKNPDINFYFNTSTIVIPHEGFDGFFTIDMAEFYEYIAIYTKYKSNNNLYEDNTNLKEFYVFANYISNEYDYVKEKGKRADNVYYTIYCYDDTDNISEENKNALKVGYRAIIKKINEYVNDFKSDTTHGYIIEGVYYSSEYEEKAGYYLSIEIASCSKKYFDEHLEDALAAVARAEKVDVSATNYSYIDEDNFEFYESYYEMLEDYTDETKKEINVYTKEERYKDMVEQEKQDEL